MKYKALLVLLLIIAQIGVAMGRSERSKVNREAELERIEVHDELTTQRIIRAKKRLNEAEPWVITDLVNFHSRFGYEDRFFRNYLSQKFNVYMYSHYLIDHDRHIFTITLTARGIYRDIRCYSREEYNGKIYEFWAVKTDGKEGAGVTRSAKFYVVEADDVKGIRRILKESDQFFSFYSVDENYTLKFPTDNWSLLNLEPWLFPLNYEKSDLDEYIVLAIDRIAEPDDPMRIEDIVWEKRRLTEEELEIYRKMQIEGGLYIDFGGSFKFPAEQ